MIKLFKLSRTHQELHPISTWVAYLSLKLTQQNGQKS